MHCLIGLMFALPLAGAKHLNYLGPSVYEPKNAKGNINLLSRSFQREGIFPEKWFKQYILLFYLTPYV